MGAGRYQDLIAWQLAFRLESWIVEFCDRPAVRRDFDYCAQLKDAAGGMCRNIAEGFGRWTHRDFHNLLRIAISSHKETENLLDEAVIRKLLSATERREIGPLVGRCGKTISSLMKSLRENPDPPSP